MYRGAEIQMQKSRWFWVLLCGAAFLSGLAGAAVVVKFTGHGNAVAGPWRANLLSGSVNADAVTRAQTAVAGLLALGRDETIYYLAREDSEGQPLRSRCSYRISGFAPDARWWSITAYAEDYFLFPGAGDRYSVNGSQVTLTADQQFEFFTGPVPVSAAGHRNGLVTPGDRPLILTLRLYNPSDRLQQDPALLRAPRLEKVGACA